MYLITFLVGLIAGMFVTCLIQINRRGDMMQDIRDVLEAVNTIKYILGFDIFMLKKLLAAGYTLKEPTYNTLEEVLKKEE